MLPRALGNKVHHVSTQRAAAAQLCPGLCLPLPELHKPSAADGHNKQPWFKKSGGKEGIKDCPGLDSALYLFVQLIAGTQSLLHRGPVVGSVEVEELHTLPLQPLQGRVQLGAHALRLQRLPIPRVGLGGHFHWQREKE